jgi:AAA domain
MSAVIDDLDVQWGNHVVPSDQTFLWWPWLPEGDVAVLAAQGGVGKGATAADIAARITRGANWPLSDERAPIGNVLWGESEDKIDKVVAPRLISAHPDMSRVAFIEPADFGDKDSTHSFIVRHGVRLIVLSPLISFMKALQDINNPVKVRRGLEHLDDIVQDTDCSVLGIMHINKKEGLSAVARVMGSVDFTNFARTTILLSRQSDDSVRMVHAKYNLSIKADDLSFNIHNTKTDSRGQYLRLEWSTPEDNVDADAVFDRRPSNGDDRKGAGAWLRRYLDDGEWHARDDVIAAAEAMSFSKSTITKARVRDSQIEADQRGFGKVKRSYWRLKIA